MRSEPFGPLDTPVPVVGHGTWQTERDDPDQFDTAVRRAIELGMTHIDTAELYGSGEVEKNLGRALRGLRDRVFLASKVMPENASAEGTVRACERSLARLATDHLDLYLLHWRGRHPLAGTIEAFELLRAQGKIRAWGVSNFDTDDLDEALAVAGPDRIACNQVLYHLAERTIEHAVIPWCERNRVAVVAYSPFGCGNFPSPRSEGGRVLETVARAHGVTPHAVALAFLTRRPSLFAIPKSSRADHVEANAAGGGLVLSPEEIERVSAAFPVGPWRGLPSL